MQLDTILPLLNKLESLVVTATPPVIERILDGVSGAEGIGNIGHLQLAASSGSSPTYPFRLLEALPLFTTVDNLDIELCIPFDTALLPSLPPSTTPLRPETVFISCEEFQPSAYSALNTFLSRFTSLLSLPHLDSLWLYSPYVDHTFFASLSPASSLTTLFIALEVGPLKTRLPNLIDLLPNHSQLEKLSLSVLSPISAPLILPPSNPLRPALLAALPPSLQASELDIDFMYPLPEEQDDYARVPSRDVLEYVVDTAGKGSALRSWRTVEWEETVRLRRDCSATKEAVRGVESWKF
jgi:hypothetical protein